MFSAEGQLCPRLALPGDRYPSHLPSFELPPDMFGPTLQHLDDTREEAPFDLFNFEIPSDLFGPIHRRLHDTHEEEEEEQEAVVAEKKESPLVTNKHDFPWVLDASESPPVHWDEIRSLYGGDTDDGVDLSDLIDYDEQEAAADVEETNCPASELPPVHWDEIRSLYGCDTDDGVDLSDLIDYDEQEAAADVEETNCPGKKFPEEKAGKVDEIWSRSYTKRNVEYQKKCEEIADSGDENATYPSFPLKVYPEATGLCVLRGNCHHRQYKTHDISSAKSTLGYREPRLMLQIFSLRLSCSEPYPVSVYGIVAVRDALEPLRNHVFNHPCRDDAVMIDQDSFTLPLCSPCRGMYILRDAALLEVELWVKGEGDGSSDKQLLSVYAEIEGRYEFDEMLDGQVTSDLGSLVIDYLLLEESVEAVIQVSAKVDRPHHVRFTAFSSGFLHEIVLFDDKFSGNENLFQHVVAVKAEGKLDVCLKLEESLFWWTFQKGAVGAVKSPDDSVLKYGQFEVRVLFAPKNVRKN